MVKSSLTSEARPTILRGEAADRASQGVLAAFDPASVRIALNPAQAMEAAHASAFKKGYEEGLDAARQDIETATEEANRAVKRSLAALSMAIDSFDQRQTVSLGDIEDSIIAFALEISRSVLQREISLLDDPGLEAVKRALKLAPGRDDVIARLNPKDAATLSIENLATNGRIVQIVADPLIEIGGCVAEVNDCTIDSQISSVLQRIAEVLNVARPAGLPEGAAGSSPSPSRMTSEEPPLP